MTRTVAHDTFVIERSYAAAPARVFAAFADPVTKMRWFGDPGSAMNASHKMDFRVGGHESMAGGTPGGGPQFSFDVDYQDIVEEERIVYTYAMTMDGRRISVSVATIEILDNDGGTRLIVTEQGVFLDGLDSNAVREQGTHELLDALGRYLDMSAQS